MQLGFVSAILPDQSLEEVFATAAELGYDCVEVMCWPRGKAERRYAGVTHIEVEHVRRESSGGDPRIGRAVRSFDQRSGLLPQSACARCR